MLHFHSCPHLPVRLAQVMEVAAAAHLPAVEQRVQAAVQQLCHLRSFLSSRRVLMTSR